jgi:hypothetical protein
MNEVFCFKTETIIDQVVINTSGNLSSLVEFITTKS